MFDTLLKASSVPTGMRRVSNSADVSITSAAEAARCRLKKVLAGYIELHHGVGARGGGELGAPNHHPRTQTRQSDVERERGGSLRCHVPPRTYETGICTTSPFMAASSDSARDMCKNAFALQPSFFNEGASGIPLDGHAKYL